MLLLLVVVGRGVYQLQEGVGPGVARDGGGGGGQLLHRGGEHGLQLLAGQTLPAPAARLLLGERRGCGQGRSVLHTVRHPPGLRQGRLLGRGGGAQGGCGQGLGGRPLLAHALQDPVGEDVGGQRVDGVRDLLPALGTLQLLSLAVNILTRIHNVNKGGILRYKTDIQMSFCIRVRKDVAMWRREGVTLYFDACQSEI